MRVQIPLPVPNTNKNYKKGENFMKKVNANFDVEVKPVIEEDVSNAISNVINELSKKYCRNIQISFKVDIK